MARGPQTRPEGLHYSAEFITRREESELISIFETLDFRAVEMRGYTAKRTTIHFGWNYGYDSWRIDPAEAIPEYLEPLRARAAEACAIDAADFVEALLTCYPAGAGIGWHRDAPMFGDVVAGISFASACTLRFRNPKVSPITRYDLLAEARSMYILRGAARREWQHSIAATPALRYSVTFRTLRNANRNHPTTRASQT